MNQQRHLLSSALGLLVAAVVATSSPAVADDLQMWERSGGNAGVVDRLVAMWNEKNPGRKIVLTYIPHAEMVAKLAQAIASGEVPDLMGLDLIYGPQFEAAGQLVDITDHFKDDPTLKTVSPGHMTVGTYQGRLYGVPLYADVSALFYNKDLFKKAGLDPNKPPTSLAEIREYADKITALGGDVKGYFLPGSCAGCNIFTVGPLMWASGATIEPKDAHDEPLQGEGVKQVLQWARDMIKAGNVHEDARGENGETFAKRFSTGNIGMMGTGNFQITLTREANPKMNFGIALLPGVEPGSAASFIGGDLVVIPKGSARVEDAIDFMKFLLSDQVQVEGYAKMLNLTTRSDMAHNKYFAEEPLVQEVEGA
jgi:multiple sugar transport system substrate-binding protein